MKRTRHAGTAGTFAAALAIVAFALAVALAVHRGRAPPWTWAFYVAASVLALAMNALDKAAAVRGARRTPERTLHALALAGGWPGALLGQRLLRHKTGKPSFLAVCWLTVALHAAAFAALFLLPRS